MPNFRVRRKKYRKDIVKVNITECNQKTDAVSGWLRIHIVTPPMKFKAVPLTPVFSSHFFIKSFLVFTILISSCVVSNNIFLLRDESRNGEDKIIQDVVVKQTFTATANRPVIYTALVKKSSITQESHLVKLPKGASNIVVKNITGEQAQEIISQDTLLSGESLTLKQKRILASAVEKTKIPDQGIKFGAVYSFIEDIKKFFLADITRVSAEEEVLDLEIPIESSVQAPEVSIESLPETPIEAQSTTQDTSSLPVSETDVSETDASELVIVEIVEAENETLVDVLSQASSEPEITTNEPEVISTEPIEDTESVKESADNNQDIPTVVQPTGNPEENNDYLQIDFQVQGPKITEQDTGTGKVVTLSVDSKEEGNSVADVLAFSNIPEMFNVKTDKQIKVKNNANEIKM